jgi:hypothetical protein
MEIKPIACKQTPYTEGRKLDLVGARKKAQQWMESGKIGAEKIGKTVKTKKTHKTNKE